MTRFMPGALDQRRTGLQVYDFIYLRYLCLLACLLLLSSCTLCFIPSHDPVITSLKTCAIELCLGALLRSGEQSIA